MQVVINIPREFEEHFNGDKFADALRRLRADANFLAGNYEVETADMLIRLFRDATVIPKGHGRLIDEREVFEELNKINGSAELDIAFEAVGNASTIIEKDEEE